MPPLWHHDFETYNDLNLKKVGLDVYASHPSLEPNLLACVDPYTGDLVQTEHLDEMLDLGAAMARDPEVVFTAFNARFERIIWQRFGIEVPLERWLCVMCWAYAMAFNGGLREVGEQLGIPADEGKLKGGTRLITKFCAPRKPTKNNTSTRVMPDDAPEDWAQFKAYNRQDVTAELAISGKLEAYPLNPVQRFEYVFSQEMNDRGLPIDTDLVEACVDIYAQEQRSLKRRMQALTGLANPGSQQQLLGWFQEQGLQIEDLKKNTVRDALKVVPPGVVRETLELRAQHARASPKKWQALARATGADGRLRGAFQLWGASRTQREAGRIFQPQNLPWPSTTLKGLPELMLTRNRDALDTIHPSVTAALVSLIRNAVTAPPGGLLGVADLSSIESVVSGWVTGCEAINTVFREGRDLYRQFGSRLYGIPEEEITAQQRQFCKPPVLSIVYGISARGLVNYAEGMGVALDEEVAQHMIDVFLDAYPEIPKCWEWLEEVCKRVTEAPPGESCFKGYGVRIWRDDEFLRIQKPDGWCLSYHKPRVEANYWGKECFSYMGKNQVTGKWVRIHARGSLTFENIVQSIARSILMHGMWLAREAGLCLIGQVHDEAIQESDEDNAQEELETLIRCLTTVPVWAPGLWLGAEGKVMKRYAK